MFWGLVVGKVGVYVRRLLRFNIFHGEEEAILRPLRGILLAAKILVPKWTVSALIGT